MSISSVNEFWETVKDSFLYDDGSLPGIDLYSLDGEEVSSIFEKILGYGVLSDKALFWHKDLENDVAINSVPNAARLVVYGKADSFHFCINDVKYEGSGIPGIGVFVFDDSIEFDYRMGPDWTKSSALSFFKFLIEMKKESKHGKLKGTEVEGPEDEAAILHALVWVESEYFT